MKAEINLGFMRFLYPYCGLKQALKSNNVTLRPVFIASIAYWLFISGIMLDALQK